MRKLYYFTGKSKNLLISVPEIDYEGPLEGSLLLNEERNFFEGVIEGKFKNYSHPIIKGYLKKKNTDYELIFLRFPLHHTESTNIIYRLSKSGESIEGTYKGVWGILPFTTFFENYDLLKTRINPEICYATSPIELSLRKMGISELYKPQNHFKNSSA